MDKKFGKNDEKDKNWEEWRKGRKIGKNDEKDEKIGKNDEKDEKKD